LPIISSSEVCVLRSPSITQAVCERVRENFKYRPYNKSFTLVTKQNQTVLILKIYPQDK
jgi:hypothetical protein